MMTPMSAFEAVLMTQVRELKEEVLELKVRNLKQLTVIHELRAQLSAAMEQSQVAA